MPQKNAADRKSTDMNKGAKNATAEHTDSDQIVQRAYELWIERGSPIGSPEVDWLRAEAELAGGDA